MDGSSHLLDGLKMGEVFLRVDVSLAGCALFGRRRGIYLEHIEHTLLRERFG
jgi:hypothetical protein